MRQINIHDNTDEALIRACGNGKLDVCKWLYSLDTMNLKINDINFYKYFIIPSVIKNKYLYILEWLHEVEIYVITPDQFKEACRQNYFECVNWMISNMNNAYVCHGLYAACEGGNFELAKWLYEIRAYSTYDPNSSVHRYLTDPFIICCELENIEIAKWLYTVNKNDNTNIINPNIFNNIFIESCKNGRFESVKWLIELEEVDVSYDNYNAFRHACENNRLEVAKFIYEKANIPIDKYMLSVGKRPHDIMFLKLEHRILDWIKTL